MNTLHSAARNGAWCRMTAETIAKALGGRKIGSGWMARCPAHEDRKPSLSITADKDGKVLLRCHAGCNQVQVINALRVRGLWKPRDQYAGRRRGYKLGQWANIAPERAAKRTEAALRIWQTSIPASGTLAEIYLQSRGLRLQLPPTLRFHAGLKHPSGRVWPALVALVKHGSRIPRLQSIAPFSSATAPARLRSTRRK